jgi:hypothetical protein
MQMHAVRHTNTIQHNHGTYMLDMYSRSSTRCETLFTVAE